jgi:hypothetical protein
LKTVKNHINTDCLKDILQSKITPIPTELNLHYFDNGRKGIVLGCNLDNGKGYVVRCISNPIKVRKLKRMHNLLSQTKCYYPQLLLVDVSLATYTKLGAFVTMEERIKGRTAQKIHFDTQMLKKALLPHYGSYYKHCMSAGVRRLKAWFKTRTDFDRSRREAYYHWFSKYRAKVNRISCFNLLHSDLGPTNYIFSNGNIYCIDFEESRFGVFWMDYWKAVVYYCHQWQEQGEKLKKEFNKAYFTTLNDPELESKLHVEKFFRGLCYLSMLSKYRRKLNKAGVDKERLRQLYRWYEDCLIRLL